MSSKDHEMQPTPNEVMQSEEPAEFTSVPVCVTEIKTPVRVQALPRKSGSTFTKRAVVDRPLQILWPDHWRGGVYLVGDGAFRVAFSEASAQDDMSMARWPADVPLPVTATTEVWVKAVTVPVLVSAVSERWADGR